MYFEGGCERICSMGRLLPWIFSPKKKEKKIKSDSWDEAFKQQGAGHNGEKQKQFLHKINFEVKTNM